MVKITGRRCPVCGSPVGVSTKYCGHCGSELPKLDDQEQTKVPDYVRKERRKSWIKVSDAFFSITMIGFIAVIIGMFLPFVKLSWGGSEGSLSIFRFGFSVELMWIPTILMMTIAVIGIIKLDTSNGIVAFVMGGLLIALCIYMPYIFSFLCADKVGLGDDNYFFSWGVALIRESMEKKFGYYIVLAGSILATSCSAIAGTICWIANYFI